MFYLNSFFFFNVAIRTKSHTFQYLKPGTNQRAVSSFLRHWNRCLQSVMDPGFPGSLITINDGGLEIAKKDRGIKLLENED